jgi:exosortase/archaeosortase family protein
VPHNAKHHRRVPGSGARSARWIAASVLTLAGGSLIALATAWRGIEAILSSHAIQLVTGQTTIAVPGRHLLILYKSTSVQSIFTLTSECSVGYLLAALLIGSAPLMLLRQLSPWRTAIAIMVTAGVLILVNVARLTAIGATVSVLGHDPGLQIAHTYLGSLVTVVGTLAAGIAFAAVLVGHRKSRRPVAA